MAENNRLNVPSRASKPAQLQKVPKNMATWLQVQLLMRVLEKRKKDPENRTQLTAMFDKMIDQVVERNDVTAFKALMGILGDKGMDSIQMILRITELNVDDLANEFGLDMALLKKLERELKPTGEVIDVEIDHTN